MEKITPVLMAGGSGTRLWPISRSCLPKQFCRLQGPRTMLQDTLLRFADPSLFEAPIVLTHDDYRFIALDQCDAVGVVPSAIGLETERRNTGVVGALSALIASRHAPDSLILLAAADHVINNLQAFLTVLHQAKPAAQDGFIVTFGLYPTTPETGYGYIEKGQAQQYAGTYKVKRFTEKPNSDVAEKYLAGKNHLWNSGIFLTRSDVLIAEYKQHAPDLLKAAQIILANAEPDLMFTRFKADDLKRAENISIDYCIMEKTSKALVVEADIGWSDVGTIPAFYALHAKDSNGNVATGLAALEQCQNTFVQAELRPVMAIGLQDIAVIDTQDALLVMNMHASDSVKAAQNQMVKIAPSVLHNHPEQATIWGKIETIETTKLSRVRRVHLDATQHITYQSHQHRTEHWLVLSGTGHAVIDGVTHSLNPGDTLSIRPNMRHRLDNPSTTDTLIILEIQTGDFDNDADIQRHTLFTDKP